MKVLLNSDCDIEDSSAIGESEFKELSKEILEWSLNEQTPVSLNRVFVFESFDDVVKFVGKIVTIAKKQKYYPNITFGSDYVMIALYSLGVEGIHKNDMIMAARIDNIFEKSDRAASIKLVEKEYNKS